MEMSPDVRQRWEAEVWQTLEWPTQPEEPAPGFTRTVSGRPENQSCQSAAELLAGILICNSISLEKSRRAAPVFSVLFEADRIQMRSRRCWTTSPGQRPIASNGLLAFLRHPPAWLSFSNRNLARR